MPAIKNLPVIQADKSAYKTPELVYFTCEHVTN